MLTKQDLSQITNIIQTAIQPVNNRLDKIDKKLNEHDKKFDNIDTQFKTVNKKLNKLQKDLDVNIDFFDDYSVKHENRLESIEHHLGLPTLSTI